MPCFSFLFFFFVSSRTHPHLAGWWVRCVKWLVHFIIGVYHFTLRQDLGGGERERERGEKQYAQNKRGHRHTTKSCAIVHGTLSLSLLVVGSAFKPLAMQCGAFHGILTEPGSFNIACFSSFFSSNRLSPSLSLPKG